MSVGHSPRSSIIDVQLYICHSSVSTFPKRCYAPTWILIDIQITCISFSIDSVTMAFCTNHNNTTTVACPEFHCDLVADMSWVSWTFKCNFIKTPSAGMILFRQKHFHNAWRYPSTYCTGPSASSISAAKPLGTLFWWYQSLRIRNILMSGSSPSPFCTLVTNSQNRLGDTCTVYSEQNETKTQIFMNYDRGALSQTLKHMC